MFESLKNIVLICVKGTIDLILGVGVNTVMTEFFPYRKNEKLLKLSLEVVAQTCLSLLVGLQARELFFNEDDAMTSPYGITFMMGLFADQDYWLKIKDIKIEIIKELFPLTNPQQSS